MDGAAKKYVLVSYKHEDEPRVSKLIRALQHHGLTIWWDQGLPGGEAWRTNIETALTEAGCVIVVWTHSSVGPEGEFVRDEAARAEGRGILVPIRLDNVMPPLGFGEIQAIDLSGWRDKTNDPFLLDLVDACKAKLEGRHVPAAKASTRRLLRRAAAGSGASAVAIAAITFGGNLFTVQDRACTMPAAQPAISDLCGAIHLGGRPDHDERLAWAARPKGSCEALRDFINRYPGGAYRSEAADLLQAASVSRSPSFTPAPRTAHGYVRQSEAPFSKEAAAQADAGKRAVADATETTCAPVGDNERLAGADLSKTTYDCRPSPLGGWACAADYVATCRIEVRAMTETCG
jgi:hypothetical protein